MLQSVLKTNFGLHFERPLKTGFTVVLSADNLCKKFGQVFDTPNAFLKEFFQKLDFEKNQQLTKAHEILPTGQRVDNLVILEQL